MRAFKLWSYAAFLSLRAASEEYRILVRKQWLREAGTSTAMKSLTSPVFLRCAQQKTVASGEGSDYLLNLPQKDSVVRVINGEATNEEEYPFAEVSVRYPNGQHMCGGSLVAPDVILTAGHCMAESVGSIQIGRYDFSNPSDTYETMTVSSKESHPSFDRQYLRYDFAVAKLSSAVQGNYSLIRINNDTAFPEAGDEVIVIGWGATDTQTWDFPHVLQETTVQVISNDACESFQLYGQRLYAGEIFDEMLCAYSLGTDACSGDSGGPLITRMTDRATQVGVVSWGRGCAQYPGVYSRVSAGYEWIRSSICALSSFPPEYLECTSGEVHSGGSSVGLDDDDSDLWGETQRPSPTPTYSSTDGPAMATLSTVSPSAKVASPKSAPPSAVTLSFVDVVVEIQLDDNSGETSWSLSHENGSMILGARNGSYASSAGMRMTQSLSLEMPSSYKFVIRDAGGDGLCCLTDGDYETVGFYRIYISDSDSSDQASTLVYGAGNFGGEESRYFSLPTKSETTKSTEGAGTVASATSPSSATSAVTSTSSSSSNQDIRYLLSFGVAIVLLALLGREGR
jgi:trypsin